MYKKYLQSTPNYRLITNKAGFIDILLSLKHNTSKIRVMTVMFYANRTDRVEWSGTSYSE